MKNRRLIVSVVALVVIGLSLALYTHSQNSSMVCGPYRDDETIKIGTHRLTAEVASTDQQRTQGLSGRPCITQNEALLFTFSQPGRYSFWMKDMKFPIDMIWISSAHKAVVIEENVQPSTYPDSFVNPADKPAQYVLELKAHASTALNINPGTPINF